MWYMSALLAHAQKSMCFFVVIFSKCNRNEGERIMKKLLEQNKKIIKESMDPD